MAYANIGNMHIGLLELVAENTVLVLALECCSVGYYRYKYEFHQVALFQKLRTNRKKGVKYVHYNNASKFSVLVPYYGSREKT